MNTSAAVTAYRVARQNIPFTKLHWNVANVVGIESALFIEIIQDWCDNNMVHQRKQYFHDDHWWTRGTYQDWEAKYPSLGSARTLQRLLLKLESGEYVLTDQFNKGKDNTKFYRVNEEKIGELYLQGLEEFRKSNVPNWHDETEVSNPSCQNGTTTMPDWHGHDAKLARSSIYKQINKTDQENPPIVPRAVAVVVQEDGGYEVSHVEVEITSEEVQVFSTSDKTKTKIALEQESLSSRLNVPARENENQFQRLTRKNPNTGKEYLPWQVDLANEQGILRVDVNPNFVRYVAKSLVSKYSKYKTMPVKELERETIKYINRAQYQPERREEIDRYWRDFEDELKDMDSIGDMSVEELQRLSTRNNLRSLLEQAEQKKASGKEWWQD